MDHAAASRRRRPWRRLHAGLGLALSVAALACSTAASGARFVTVPSGRDDLALFAMLGGIEGGETLELTRLVSLLPPSQSVAVLLNSPGGNLQEGIELGRFLYKTRIATFTLGDGGSCASACAIAFLGGRDRQGRPSRTMLTNSRLGFHQFRPIYNGDAEALRFTKTQMEERAVRTHRVILNIIAYLNEISEDLGKLDLMLAAPTEAIRNVTKEEASTLGFNVLSERSTALIDASNIRSRVER